jgi:streptogramin lyase
VVIFYFAPEQAAYDATVTIAGSGFGATASLNTVTLNGVTAAVLSASATLLEIKVPRDLNSTGTLKVKVGQKEGSAPTPFTYQPTSQLSTFTGSPTGISGSVDGVGTAARFNFPDGIAVDAQNDIYVTDTLNRKIRKITPAGSVTTFAGSGVQGSADGIGTVAQFSLPRGVTVDPQGNVYVADSNNDNIRKITPAGVVSTFAGNGNPQGGFSAGFADGIGTAARFDFPHDIAVDAQGNIYVADAFNYCIRKITPAGLVSTFAGSGIPGSADGVGKAAQFDIPYYVTVDAQGNVYVSEYFGHRVRKITPAGVVSTFAGSDVQGSADGVGTAAQFLNPQSMVVDAGGNVYVIDGGNAIRRITRAGVVTTLTTFGGSSMAMDAQGNIYVTAIRDNRIIKITLQ